MYSIGEKQFPCNTSLTMSYIGGNWNAVILIHLIEKKRYSELRRDCALITERTLSLQLKELEADGLVTRTVHTTKPPLKVDYELTALGSSLIPLLEAIDQWGSEAAEKDKRVKRGVR